MMKKLRRNKHGETLTEVLVAVLIVALSAALLATMISTSVNINMRANEANDRLLEDLTSAETGENPIAGTVTINGVVVDVDVYGDGTLTSYVKG